MAEDDADGDDSSDDLFGLGDDESDSDEEIQVIEDIVLKIAKAVVKRGLSAEELFRRVDTDGSGELDRDELAAVVRKLHRGFTEEELDKLFHFLDADGGGTVSVDEFCQALETFRGDVVIQSPIGALSNETAAAAVPTTSPEERQARLRRLHEQRSKALEEADADSERAFELFSEPEWDDILLAESKVEDFDARPEERVLPGRKCSPKREGHQDTFDKLSRTHFDHYERIRLGRERQMAEEEAELMHYQSQSVHRKKEATITPEEHERAYQRLYSEAHAKQRRQKRRMASQQKLFSEVLPGTAIREANARRRGSPSPKASRGGKPAWEEMHSKGKEKLQAERVAKQAEEAEKMKVFERHLGVKEAPCGSRLWADSVARQHKLEIAQAEAEERGRQKVSEHLDRRKLSPSNARDMVDRLHGEAFVWRQNYRDSVSRREHHFDALDLGKREGPVMGCDGEKSFHRGMARSRLLYEDAERRDRNLEYHRHLRERQAFEMQQQSNIHSAINETENTPSEADAVFQRMALIPKPHGFFAKLCTGQEGERVGESYSLQLTRAGDEGKQKLPHSIYVGTLDSDATQAGYAAMKLSHHGVAKLQDCLSSADVQQLKEYTAKRKLRDKTKPQSKGGDIAAAADAELARLCRAMGARPPGGGHERPEMESRRHADSTECSAGRLRYEPVDPIDEHVGAVLDNFQRKTPKVQISTAKSDSESGSDAGEGEQPSKMDVNSGILVSRFLMGDAGQNAAKNSKDKLAARRKEFERKRHRPNAQSVGKKTAAWKAPKADRIFVRNADNSLSDGAEEAGSAGGAGDDVAPDDDEEEAAAVAAEDKERCAEDAAVSLQCYNCDAAFGEHYNFCRRCGARRPEEGWPERQIKPKEPVSYQVPEVLHLRTEAHASAAGSYAIVPNHRPNGLPLWKKEDDDLWLYGRAREYDDVQWLLGDLNEKQFNFDSDTGLIVSRNVSVAIMPHKVLEWLVLRKKEFVEDDRVTMSAASFVAMQFTPTSLRVLDTSKVVKAHKKTPERQAAEAKFKEESRRLYVQHRTAQLLKLSAAFDPTKNNPHHMTLDEAVTVSHQIGSEPFPQHGVWMHEDLGVLHVGCERVHWNSEAQGYVGALLWNLTCTHPQLSKSDRGQAVLSYQQTKPLPTHQKVGRARQGEYFQVITRKDPSGAAAVSAENHFQIYATPAKQSHLTVETNQLIPCRFVLAHVDPDHWTQINDGRPLERMGSVSWLRAGDKLTLGEVGKREPTMCFKFDLNGSILSDAGPATDMAGYEKVPALPEPKKVPDSGGTGDEVETTLLCGRPVSGGMSNCIRLSAWPMGPRSRCRQCQEAWATWACEAAREARLDDELQGGGYGAPPLHPSGVKELLEKFRKRSLRKRGADVSDINLAEEPFAVLSAAQLKRVQSRVKACKKSVDAALWSKPRGQPSEKKSGAIALGHKEFLSLLRRDLGITLAEVPDADVTAILDAVGGTITLAEYQSLLRYEGRSDGKDGHDAPVSSSKSSGGTRRSMTKSVAQIARRTMDKSGMGGMAAALQKKMMEKKTHLKNMEARKSWLKDHRYLKDVEPSRHQLGALTPDELEAAYMAGGARRKARSRSVSPESDELHSPSKCEKNGGEKEKERLEFREKEELEGDEALTKKVQKSLRKGAKRVGGTSFAELAQDLHDSRVAAAEAERLKALVHLHEGAEKVPGEGSEENKKSTKERPEVHGKGPKPKADAKANAKAKGRPAPGGGSRGRVGSDNDKDTAKRARSKSRSAEAGGSHDHLAHHPPAERCIEKRTIGYADFDQLLREYMSIDHESLSDEDAQKLFWALASEYTGRVDPQVVQQFIGGGFYAIHDIDPQDRSFLWKPRTSKIEEGADEGDAEGLGKKKVGKAKKGKAKAKKGLGAATKAKIRGKLTAGLMYAKTPDSSLSQEENMRVAMDLVVKKLDKDGTGMLELAELQKAVRMVMKIPKDVVSDKQIQDVMDELDGDGSGAVRAEEIIAWLTEDDGEKASKAKAKPKKKK
eukprot:TRINITY_DN18779_c0_g2_i1.p1 TRINITY_DN18779_c0_g2~~TRINITY_DN18779_c0_g2_i1.p1  ORF type:complete len:2004 (+),score=587.90 TRINITY_DN18779_c0_g2_i1:82-6093(+)